MDCCYRCWSDCESYLVAGHKLSGVYYVYPEGMRTGYGVYCDMTTDGGGWLVRCSRVFARHVHRVQCLLWYDYRWRWIARKFIVFIHRQKRGIRYLFQYGFWLQSMIRSLVTGHFHLISHVKCWWLTWPDASKSITHIQTGRWLAISLRWRVIMKKRLNWCQRLLCLMLCIVMCVLREVNSFPTEIHPSTVLLWLRG